MGRNWEGHCDLHLYMMQYGWCIEAAQMQHGRRGALVLLTTGVVHQTGPVMLACCALSRAQQ